VLVSQVRATEVRLVTVEARYDSEAPPILTATGKIVSDHRVQVSTKVSGQIVGLFFEQGDKVAKGQILARLEDVNPKALRDQAAAQLERAKATLEFARFNYERAKGLFNQNTAPQIELVDARRAMQEAESQVAANKAALDYAQKQLDDCQVVAPISGVVLERNVEVGDFVAAEGGRGANANAQFALIADMSKLRVEVDVSELDIARIRKGMPCTIIPEAYKDRRYEGHVMWLDPGANYSKATVQVKIRIDQPDDYLRVEGSAQVVFLSKEDGRITTAPATQAVACIWIPVSACLVDASGRKGIVFLADEGRLKKTVVSVGRRMGGQVEVKSGLREGQSIVAGGLEQLADGQKYRS